MLAKFYTFLKKAALLAIFALAVNLVFTQSPVLAADSNTVDQPTKQTTDAIQKQLKSQPSETGSTLLGIISYLFSYGIYAVGALLFYLLIALNYAFKWQNFNDIQGIQVAWEALRDICNGGFIIVLLFIAFATILRKNTYSIENALPKVLLMTIVINFSATITKLLIDISNVVMVMFVKAWEGSLGMDAGAGIVASTGVYKAFTFYSDMGSSKTFSELGNTKIFLAMFFAFIFSVIVMIIVAAMTWILIRRMVALWVTISLSPLAAFSFGLPGKGRNYFDTWWSTLWANLTAGPTLTFFTWLTFVVMEGIQKNSGNLSMNYTNTGGLAATADSYITDILTSSNLQAYLVAIIFLYTGIVATSKSQVGGAKLGLSMLNTAEGWGKKALAGTAKKVPGVQLAIDAKEAWDARRAMIKTEKESDRKKRVLQIGQEINTAISYIKSPVKNISKKIDDNIFGGARNKELEENIKTAETQNTVNSQKIADLENKIAERMKSFNDKQSFTDRAGNIYTHNRATNTWFDQSGAVVTPNMTTINQDDQNEVNTLQADQAAREAGTKALRDELQQRQRNQKRTKAILSTAIDAGLGGLIGGGVFGLAGGVVGSIIGGAGGFTENHLNTPTLWDKMKRMGERDATRVINYEANEVKSSRDKIKDESDANIKSIIDDESKDTFSRMAALLEAMNKKILSPKDAQKKMDLFQERISSNKAIKGQFNTIIEKNYQSLTSLFKNTQTANNLAAGATPTPEQERSQQVSKSSWEKGNFTLENLSLDGIEMTLQQMINGLSPEKFATQFERIDQVKQRELLKLLKTSNTEQARIKIAKIEGISAFNGHTDEQNRFLKTLSQRHLQSTILDGGKKLEDLIQAIGSDITKLSDSVQVQLRNPRNRGLARDLGIII